MASIGSAFPTGILVDMVEPTPAEDGSCSVSLAPIDLGDMLKSVNRAVLFAVPGAFTGTCSSLHLPSFINNEKALRDKGVDEVYCLSVNDKSVMKAWGQHTPNFPNSGIKMLADGSAELTRALGMQFDLTSHRMGIRSLRYAMIIENGVITSINVDEKGLKSSSAEHILSLLM